MSRRKNSNNYKPGNKPQRNKYIEGNKPGEQGPKTSNHENDTYDAKDTSGKDVKEGVNTNSTSANDPEWYKKFPELAYGAANLPFGEALGTSISLGDVSINLMDDTATHTYKYDADNNSNSSIPGVCTLYTKPTYGSNFDYNDPLNVAANQFYTNVRYVNSGRKNYDPADLMISEIGISELYSFINWCQRTYGYAYMYSVRNKYINKALLDANNVNAANISANLANFRYWLNTFISRVSAFAVPADINIFRRRAYMYAHLYTESTTGNIKDQMYQFAPDGFHRFELDSTGKGMLKYYPLQEFKSGKWTLNDIVSFGEHLLENINGDEDFGLMSGDIIKAYGSNLLRLEPVPEALIIIPEYEEFTLSQMRNAHVVTLLRGSTASTVHPAVHQNESFTTGDVMQSNNGNLVTVEGISDDFDYKTVGAVLPGIISVTNPNPSIDDVLEATRLVTAGNQQDSRISQNDDIIVIECGSDVVINYTISRYTYANGAFVLQETGVSTNVVLTTQNVNITVLQGVHFHWSPVLYSVHTTTSGTTITMDDIHPFTNVDNYTTLSLNNVHNLHEVCLLSLLSVPGVAQLVS